MTPQKLPRPFSVGTDDADESLSQACAILVVTFAVFFFQTFERDQ